MAQKFDPQYPEDYPELESTEPRVGSSFGSIEDEADLQERDSLLDDGDGARFQGSKPRRSLKGPIIAVVSIVALAAAGFFGFQAFDSYQQQQEAEKVQQQEQEAEREKAEAIEEAENPFSVLVGEVDPPSETPLDLVVEADQLKVGGSTLSVAGATLLPTVNGCSLVAITDICLGARGTLGDGDFDVIAVKDISRTRILDNPTSFAEVENAGSTIAASLSIDIEGNSEPSRFGALAARGSSTGFVLIFPEGTSEERVKEIISAATVI